MLTENSKIEFYKLRFSSQPDNHNLYGVVRWDTDDSLKIDSDMIKVIEFLSEGKTIKEAAKKINFSPDVVVTVLRILEKAHFFKSIDGVLQPDTTEKINPWLIGISRNWFKWILFKPLIISVLLFSFIGLISGILAIGIPSYTSFFWTSDIFVVFVSLFFIGIFLLLLHESFHFIATKAIGGEAKMSIGYRYIFIVAETECYHLAIFPKKLRYIIYFAGSICDIFIIALLYWILIFTNIFHFHIGLLYNLFIAIILMQFIGIIWEFNVFLETDMYNFLSDYLGIENLRNDSLKFIELHSEKWKGMVLFPVKRILKFVSEDFSEESDDLRFMTNVMKNKLRIYIIFLIVGLLAMTLQYVFYSIPRDFTYVYQGVKGDQLAIKNANILSFFKYLLIIILVTYEYFLLFYLKLKSRKKLRLKTLK